MNTELQKKYSRMNTADLKRKADKATGADKNIIDRILANRATPKSTTVEIIKEATIKKSGKKAAVTAKKAAPKAAAKEKPPKAEKEAPAKKAPAKKTEGEAKPKKKSEKVGETKSDRIRVMLKEGKSSGEIIKIFGHEGIKVRYPEVRRNRIWLEEKENWVAPVVEKPVKEEKEEVAEEKPAPVKKGGKKATEA